MHRQLRYSAFAIALASALGALGPANAAVIDNGIAAGTLGHWSVDVANGGESRSGTITANGLVSGLTTTDVLFDYFTYISTGATNFRLGNAGAAPIVGGAAVSGGSFTGSSGNPINWSASSTIPAAGSVMTTTFTFNAASGTLGNLRLFQYLDEDVLGPSSDVFFARGASATGNLELFTVDNTEVFGVSHSGAFSAAQGLVNSSFVGCAVDAYNNMKPRLDTGTQSVADSGGANPCHTPVGLAALVHPQVGAALGTFDIVSVMAWDALASATSATIVTTLGGVPDVRFVPPPTGVPEPGSLALVGIALTALAARRRRA